MRLAKYAAFCLLLIGLCAARVHAQMPPGQPPTGDVKAFVTEYVAAFNAKDVQRMHALYHPKSLACITPANKSFYDDELSHRWGNTIPANYMAMVMPVNEGNVKALESMMIVFPVKPAQEVQIDYQLGDDGFGITLWLARENGRLFDDEPCATDQYIKKVQEEAPANAKLNAHYKESRRRNQGAAARAADLAAPRTQRRPCRRPVQSGDGPDRPDFHARDAPACRRSALTSRAIALNWQQFLQSIPAADDRERVGLGPGRKLRQREPRAGGVGAELVRDAFGEDVGELLHVARGGRGECPRAERDRRRRLPGESAASASVPAPCT